MKGWYKMRLIDANRAMEIVRDQRIAHPNAYHLTNYATLILQEAPTVDAVEVVRCKDCKHWLKDVPGCTDFVGRCELANYMIGAVGYCVYGERRIGNAAD